MKRTKKRPQRHSWLIEEVYFNWTTKSEPFMIILNRFNTIRCSRRKLRVLRTTNNTFSTWPMTSVKAVDRSASPVIFHVFKSFLRKLFGSPLFVLRIMNYTIKVYIKTRRKRFNILLWTPFPWSLNWGVWGIGWGSFMLES